MIVEMIAMAYALLFGTIGIVVYAGIESWLEARAVIRKARGQ